MRGLQDDPLWPFGVLYKHRVKELWGTPTVIENINIAKFQGQHYMHIWKNTRLFYVKLSISYVKLSLNKLEIFTK